MLHSIRMMSQVCWRWLALPSENRFPCEMTTWLHASFCLLGFGFFPAAIFTSQTQSRAADRVETVAGTGRDSVNGREGPAETVNIGEPFGVEVGPDRGLYITEVKNHRVWRMDLASKKLAVVAGNGSRGYSGDGGLATDAQLNEPYEVRFDADGNMYFVEMMNHLIRRVDRKTQRISTVAGAPEPGFAGDGGPAKLARFRQPHSIALDGRDGLSKALPTVGLAPHPEVVSDSPHLVETQRSTSGDSSRCSSEAHCRYSRAACEARRIVS